MQQFLFIVYYQKTKKRHIDEKQNFLIKFFIFFLFNEVDFDR